MNVINVSEGFEAEIIDSAETNLTLEVSGLKAYIEPLRQETVSGVVDIATWMQESGIENLKEGSYMIPITFSLNENITLKDKVIVKISIKEAE